MKQTIYEEIQRMSLLSKYDNSKTLSEQTSSITPEQQIAYDFYDVAAKGPGTNPTKMLDAIKKINSADLFWKVNDGVKKNSGGMDIAAVINDELDSNNLFTAQSIFNHLKSIGIVSTYGYNGKNYTKNTFKVTTTPAESKAKLDASNAYYAGEADKAMAASKSKNTQKPKTTITIPTELKDENGIKLFQDWLDTNAKGWAQGYRDGIINKGQNGGGYGKFGPRTQKAWATYKSKYLTPTAQSAEQPVEPTQAAYRAGNDVK